MADLKLDLNRTALVVIDLQKGIVSLNRKLELAQLVRLLKPFQNS